MSEPIRVTCHCPGTPHENDEITLADELPTTAGIAAATALATADGDSVAAAVTGAMLRNGVITGWNLVDEAGDPLPVTAANVTTRLTWLKGGIEVGGEVLARFVNAKHLSPLPSSTSRRRNGRSSPRGRTATSTSPSKSSSPEPAAPSA